MQVWIFSWDGDGGWGECGGGGEGGGCMEVFTIDFAVNNINTMFKTIQMLAINTSMKLNKAVGS